MNLKIFIFDYLRILNKEKIKKISPEIIYLKLSSISEILNSDGNYIYKNKVVQINWFK